MKTLQKGFTLIELLVVIAIIGILSSIVLASLSSARTKGEDAAIQSTLSNIRAQAELYYSSSNDYVGPATTCTTGIFNNTETGGLRTLVASAQGRTTVSCQAASSTWAVSALLKAPVGSLLTYCVDSTGGSKATTSQLASGITSCGF